MTNQLQKQFYEVFGIEPKYKTCPFKHCIYKKEYDCDNCDNREWHYPQITDRILLKLIYLVENTDYFLITDEGMAICFAHDDEDIEVLKNSVLRSLTIYSGFYKDLKQKVQAVFKENN